MINNNVTCTKPSYNSIHDDKRVWDWRKRRHFLWSNASDAENHLHIYKKGAHLCIRSDIGQVGMFPVSAQVRSLTFSLPFHFQGDELYIF